MKSVIHRCRPGEYRRDFGPQGVRLAATVDKESQVATLHFVLDAEDIALLRGGVDARLALRVFPLPKELSLQVIPTSDECALIPNSRRGTEDVQESD